MASCGNTHTPDTILAAAATATVPAHPVLPPPPQHPLLPAPRPHAHLAHGIARHKTQEVQDTKWAGQMGLESKANQFVRKPDGSKGFIDHIIYLDAAHREAVITEYKTDRFDRHTPASLQRRVDQILKQIDGYRFSNLDLDTSQSLLHIDHRPTTEGYAEFIEGRCADAGVTVIFLDE